MLIFVCSLTTPIPWFSGMVYGADEDGVRLVVRPPQLVTASIPANVCHEHDTGKQLLSTDESGHNQNEET